MSGWTSGIGSLNKELGVVFYPLNWLDSFKVPYGFVVINALHVYILKTHFLNISFCYNFRTMDSAHRWTYTNSAAYTLTICDTDTLHIICSHHRSQSTNIKFCQSGKSSSIHPLNWFKCSVYKNVTGCDFKMLSYRLQCLIWVSQLLKPVSTTTILLKTVCATFNMHDLCSLFVFITIKKLHLSC